jgi:hypothetical protein
VTAVLTNQRHVPDEDDNVENKEMVIENAFWLAEKIVDGAMGVADAKELSEDSFFEVEQ